MKVAFIVTFRYLFVLILCYVCICGSSSSPFKRLTLLPRKCIEIDVFSSTGVSSAEFSHYNLLKLMELMDILLLIAENSQRQLVIELCLASTGTDYNFNSTLSSFLVQNQRKLRAYHSSIFSVCDIFQSSGQFPLKCKYTTALVANQQCDDSGKTSLESLRRSKERKVYYCPVDVFQQHEYTLSGYDSFISSSKLLVLRPLEFLQSVSSYRRIVSLYQQCFFDRRRNQSEDSYRFSIRKTVTFLVPAFLSDFASLSQGHTNKFYYFFSTGDDIQISREQVIVPHFLPSLKDFVSSQLSDCPMSVDTNIPAFQNSYSGILSKHRSILLTSLDIVLWDLHFLLFSQFVVLNHRGLSISSPLLHASLDYLESFRRRNNCSFCFSSFVSDSALFDTSRYCSSFHMQRLTVSTRQELSQREKIRVFYDPPSADLKWSWSDYYHILDRDDSYGSPVKAIPILLYFRFFSSRGFRRRVVAAMVMFLLVWYFRIRADGNRSQKVKM
jgi:hypothetical protein